MDKGTVELIKQQSILEAARLLNILVKGKVAMCYTGHDKNPSLTFNDKMGYFKCFGCDAKGDIIKLVMDVKSLSFQDACLWLLSAFNLSGGDLNTHFGIKSNPQQHQRDKALPKEYKRPNQEIYEWVLEALDLSEQGADYLINKRGFPADHIHTLEIRDIPHPRVFFSKLRAKFDEHALLACGLLRQDNDRVKDLWWDYVLVFPFRDTLGHLYYMQGRRMLSVNNKYINLNQVQPGVYNAKVLCEMNPGDSLVFLTIYQFHNCNLFSLFTESAIKIYY